MAEFPLLGVLIVVIALAIIQVALIMHTRSTLTDAAVQGARFASLEGSTLEDGRERTLRIIQERLGDRYGATAEIEQDPAGRIRVQVTAAIPLIGLLGPGGTLVVDGHATAEEVWSGREASP